MYLSMKLRSAGTARTSTLTVGAGNQVDLDPKIMNFIRKSPYSFLNLKELCWPLFYFPHEHYGRYIIRECVFYIQKALASYLSVILTDQTNRCTVCTVPFLLFITPFIDYFVCIVSICFLVVGFGNWHSFNFMLNISFTF